MSCFWKCFQRLLYWISNEYCPNFFIPENNMFAGKVYGAARISLLSVLVPLYQEGYYCLLRCPSIQNELHAIIQLPQLVHLAETTDESEKCSIETRLTLEVWNCRPVLIPLNQTEISNHILDVNKIITTNNNTLENEVLQLWRNYFTQILYLSSCFEINAMNENDQIGQLSMMDMPAIDTSRHLLYTALYYYRRGSYDAAFNLPYDCIAVPPLVFAYFVYFLCYFPMARPTDSQSMLKDLSLLVQHDNGYHICQRDNAVSWQILGICQEMSGDNHGAYQSYCKALQQKYCRIGAASLIRIQNLTQLQRIP